MTVTDEDRRAVEELLFPELADLMEHNRARIQFGDEAHGQIDRVAAALASERQAARAPFVELIRRWNDTPPTSTNLGHFLVELRRLSEETP